MTVRVPLQNPEATKPTNTDCKPRLKVSPRTVPITSESRGINLSARMFVCLNICTKARVTAERVANCPAGSLKKSIYFLTPFFNFLISSKNCEYWNNNQCRENRTDETASESAVEILIFDFRQLDTVSRSCFVFGLFIGFC